MTYQSPPDIWHLGGPGPRFKQCIGWLNGSRRIREAPYNLDRFPEWVADEEIQQWKPVGEPTIDKLFGAADRLHEQVRRYLLPETYQLIAGHLARLDYILVSEGTGLSDEACYGLSQPHPSGPTYIAIALNDSFEKKAIEEFWLGSTKFHELGHVVDPKEDRIPYLDFQDRLQEIYDGPGLTPDIEMIIALADPIEAGVRSFECALHGTHDTDTELWREQHQPVVELVNRYQLTLFQPPPIRRIRRKTVVKQASPQTIIYPASTKLAVIDTEPPTEQPDTIVEYKIRRCPRVNRTGRVWVHSPLQRGITRWVKEQARQAVLNPDRAWYGALAEYLQLKNGTHPDPDPAELIYPYNPDRYDPNNLEIEPVQLRMADDAAKDWVTNPIFNNGETKPRNPWQEAIECYKRLTKTGREQETRLAQQAEYDLSNPQRRLDYDQRPHGIPTENPRIARPDADTPLQIGITRWVKEQARQAAKDPDRPWHGALAEYLQLKNGTHPDPDPAKLIYLYNPDQYDPNNLEVDPTDLVEADHNSYRWVKSFECICGQPHDCTCPPTDDNRQQLEAAECYKYLSKVFQDQKRRLAQQAEYDIQNSPPASDPRVYGTM